MGAEVGDVALLLQLLPHQARQDRGAGREAQLPAVRLPARHHFDRGVRRVRDRGRGRGRRVPGHGVRAGDAAAALLLAFCQGPRSGRR